MGSNLDPLRRELAAMREAMARQQARIEQQQARIEQLEAGAPEPPAGPRRSRRQMLKLAGATLAGAAAGAAGIASASSPASAATGDNMILGHSSDFGGYNVADKATEVRYSGVPNVGAAFIAQAGVGSGVGNPASSPFPSALAGWTLHEFMPNGIYGFTQTTAGAGVVAFNGHDLPEGPHPGLHAESLRGYAGEFWIQANGKAQLFLKPSSSPGAPAPAGHQNGELYVDSNGVLYYFVGGAFKRVALGQGGLTTMLSAPIRLLESRPQFEDPSPGQTKPHRPIGTGERWEVPITGQVMGGQQVPTGAKAVIGNVTATNPIGAGYLTLFPHGAPQPGTSSINYGAGATVANGVIVGLSSDGLVDFYASAQTDVIFDAAGYIV